MPGAVTVGQLIVNLSANTADLKSDLAGSTATVKQSAQEMTNAWAGVTASTGNVNAAGKALIATLKEQIATFGMSDQQLIQYKANMAGVGGEVQALNARLQGMKDASAAYGDEVKKAGGHTEQFSLSTAGARRELIVLAHEMSQGNYSKFGGSLLVLAERTNAASLLFSGLGLALGALAAVVGLTGYELYKMHSEIDGFNKSIQLTGNFAGATRDSLNSMAASIESSATGGVHKATEVLDGLAATGHFTAGAMLATGQSALKFAQLTGQSSEDVVKFFDGMSSGVTAWAETANKSYHFLNAAQYEHIATLEKEGNSQQAVIEAMNLMNASLDKNVEHISYWEANARGWRIILDGLGESMRKFAFPTVNEQIEKESAKLAELREKFSRVGPGLGGGDQIQADIVKQVKIVNDLMTQAIRERVSADQKSERDVANLHAVAAQKDLDQIKIGLKTRDELRADAEAKIRKDADIINANAIANGKQIVETADDVAKLVAASNAKYSDKAVDDRAAQLNYSLDLEKGNFQEQTSLYNERIKQLDLYHTKFGLSDDDFYAGRENARAEYMKAAADSYDKESDLVANFDNKNSKEEADSNRTLQKMFANYQKFVADMNGVAALDSVSAIAAWKKGYDDMIDALDKAGQSSLKSLDDQIAKEQKHALEIGHTKEQIDILMKAEQDKATAQMQNDANAIEDLLKQKDLNKVARGIYEEQLDQLNAQIEKRKILSGLKGDAAAAEAAAHDLAVSKKLADQTIQDWKNVGTSISEALTSAFGSAGHAAGGMFKAYADNAARQLQINKELAIAATKKDGDPTKIREIDDLRRQSGQAQVKSYADMADAAQGFFEQGSKGYEAMHAASVVLHGAEVALSLIKGVNAVLTQGEGDPYSAFVRMAAMAAIVTGLGVAISGGGGGGGGQSAADVQKAQGTGSVFGDVGVKNQTTGVMGYVEKSDSVRHAIEGLKANSDSMLPINQGMLTALQSIEASMVGLTNLVVRTPGLTDGSNFGIQTGTIGKSTGASIMSGAAAGAAVGSYFGPIGTAIGAIGGAIIGGLKSIWGKTTQNIVDSGLQYGGSVRGLQSGKGFDQYASVDTTTSSWFGLSKSTSNSVQTQGLTDELSKQFGLIFTNLDQSLQAASVALGGSASDITAVLDNLTLESTKVSLKGLTGTALTDALNSVISKSMDEIAQAAFPQLDQFRKVGEGYAETVVRIAGDYAKLDAILAGSSTTFGATGMASIAARERLIELAGGIDQLASQSNSFAQNFLSKAEQLAPVQKYVTDQLAAMGLQGLDTRDKFKDVVLGLANSGALATEAGAKEYTALLALADAFSKTHAATVDLTKSEQEIADERKGLQDQLNQLTMTQAQLATKARDAIDAHNQALYDQVQAAQAAKDALQASLSAAQGLLDAAGQAYSNLQTVVGKQKDALNASYQTASDALMTGINSVTGAVSKLQGLSQALHSTLDSMTVPGQEKADRQAAQAQIEGALAIAKAGGPLPDVADLQKALTTVGKDASGQFGSYLDYQRDLYRTKNNVAGLAGYTDAQLSTDQLMLKSLQDQKTALDVSHKQDLAALDAILGQAKNQVDALNGISTSLMTLPQALAAIAAAIAAVQANPIASGGPAVTAAYQQYLGRAPEAGAVDYWKGQIGQGVDAVGSIKGSEEAKIQDLYKSLLGRTGETAGVDSWEKAHAAGQSWDQIKQGFMNSTEYKALHPPGFADGGSHMGGLRMVGEDGPEVEATGPSRIWNASQMRDAMNGGSNDALAAEVRALRAEVSQMRAAAERTATSTEKVEKVITRVGGRGDYFTTKEVV